MVLNILQEVFLGKYRFERKISMPILIYEGTAYFTKSSPFQIEYFEEGVYRRAEEVYDAYQQREFQLHEESFSLLKADGSLLHHFYYPLIERKEMGFPLEFSHTHVCNDDLYHCLLSVENQSKFFSCYRIEGPSKNYEIKTIYNRLT